MKFVPRASRLTAGIAFSGMLWFAWGLVADTRIVARDSPHEFFVAPTGVATNPGTIDQPIDLTSALSTQSPARPGDTIWLLGGTYAGTYVSRISGTASAPITVRQYPGVRATLDCAGFTGDLLTVYGDWVTFSGFELTSSDLNRFSGEPGPWPSDFHRGSGVNSWGTNLKFINLVFHDLAAGMGVWKESVNTEVYGSLIFHNGWQAPDGSHGHGIYTQNLSGTRLLRENIAFNQFSNGIHAYGSNAAYLNNITLEGNVAFNNGVLGASGFERDLLIGGGVVAQNPVMRENYTYGGALSNLGYGAGCTNGQVLDNYFVGSTPLILVACTPVMTGNTFYNLQAARWGWGAGQFQPQDYPNNMYYAQPPAANFIKVRPNIYERGRGNVIVYNWLHLNAVQVDLTPARLVAGDQFEVRDAQNFYGPPIVSGIFSGAPVSIPMNGLTISPPVGQVPVMPSHTAPEFAVFVVMRSITSPPTPPMAEMPILAPAGGTFSGPVNVTLASATVGATIRYTLDGSTPTSTSALYSGALLLSSSVTVRARAFAPSMLDSVVAGASFTISLPAASLPTISPTGGSFAGPVTVTLASATPGATLRYTLDGSTPTSTSTLYATPLAVTSSATLKARASAPGLTDSAVASATFTIAAASAGTSAAFVRLDTTTQGSWHGVYGVDGALVIGDATRLPAYAQVTPSVQTGWTWAVSTTEVRGLQRLNTPDRLASGWYGGAFAVDVNLPDGQVHQVALYSVDWDTSSRAQRVDIRDAVTGALLDSRALSSFNGGQYLVWQLRGHVTLQFTCTAGSNALVNGLFFDAAGVGAAATPTISPTGGSFAGPVTVTLASATPGATLRYTLDGSTPTSTSTLYATPLAVTSSATLKARASAPGLTDSAVASATFTIAAASAGTSAAFVRLDTTTQGSWHGVYGVDGALVIGDATRLPAYAQVTPSVQTGWTWAVSTTEVRGLQRLNTPDRLASGWYGGAFAVDVNLPDGQVHQVALYSVDWDTSSRAQRVDIRDAVTGALLDSRALSSFNGGQYLVWQLRGHVTLQFTCTAGSNALVNGLFFDAAGVGAAATPTISPTGGSFAGPVTVTLASATPGATLRYTLDGSTPTSTSTLYATPLAVTSSATLKARASAPGLTDSAVASATFTIAAASAGTSAAFVRLDTTTQGSWHGVYGVDGALVIGDATRLPAYAQVTPSVQTGWTWAVSTTEVRGLQRLNTPDRLASGWYGGAFAVDVNLPDGQVHQVALYSVDWDTSSRAQRVDIRDAVTGALLDSRALSSFNGGQYLVWQVSGHVTIQITRTSGSNAVLSGLFFR